MRTETSRKRTCPVPDPVPVQAQLAYAKKELEQLSVLADYSAQVCYEMVRDAGGDFEYAGDASLVDNLIEGLKKLGYMS